MGTGLNLLADRWVRLALRRQSRHNGNCFHGRRLVQRGYQGAYGFAALAAGVHRDGFH